jgi:osmoprotectant transport system permease protein
MIDYFIRYHNRLGIALLQHLEILGITLFISLILASLLTLVIHQKPRLAAFTLRLLGAVYAIPSLALFAILIPFLGIGLKTAVFVLVLYNQFLLVRNFLAGLQGVDPLYVHTAIGMGMTDMQILLRIKLPLSFPVIMAGIRLSVISTIGIATIAAAINAGGIGTILFDGLRTLNTAKILWGALLSSGLAVAANASLNALERFAERKMGGRKGLGTKD